MKKEYDIDELIETEYVIFTYAGEEILIRADSEFKIKDVVAYILLTKDDVDDISFLCRIIPYTIYTSE